MNGLEYLALMIRSKIFFLGLFGAVFYNLLALVISKANPMGLDYKNQEPWKLFGKYVLTAMYCIFFIVFGAAFTYIVATSGENDFFTMLKGFSWPGIFMSMLNVHQATLLKEAVEAVVDIQGELAK